MIKAVCKTRAWLGVAAVAALLAGTGSGAQAQSCDFGCAGDTLALRAPQSLRARVQRGVVTGNVLTWAPLPDSLSSCAAIRLIKPPFTLPAFNPELSGSYIDVVDRQLKFSAESNGAVGDRIQNSVVLTWNNLDTQAGPLSGGVAGSINVSNAGGIFQVAPATGAAVQVNAGIPPYLFPATNVRSIDTWASPDARPSRAWAALTGNSGSLVLRADFGPGGTPNWVALLDPKLPNASALARFSPIAIAAARSSPDAAFLGTVDNGVYRTTDAGQSWTKLTLDPTLTPGAKESVSFLGYVGNALFAALRNVALYRSLDDGATWAKLPLQTPAPDANGAYCPSDATVRNPAVLSMAVDPGNPNQIYAGLQSWGVYVSPDGGNSWQRRNTNLVLCPTPTVTSGVPADVIALMVDRGATNVLLASVAGRGLYRSTDFGADWAPIGGVPTNVNISSFVQDPGNSAIITAATDQGGLLRSVDGAVSWSAFGTGLSNPNLAVVIADPTAPGGLLVGTEGAGIYQPGTAVPLSRTIKTGGTDPDKLNLQLGLNITFDEGPVSSADSLFVVRAQTFQGYAVWRGRTPDPSSMQLVGLYDRTNPEECFADPCDAEFPRRVQGCFADKRAACFTFSGTDSVSFFDRDVYNGFTYYYAVSTVDYGYSGNIFPTALDREMLFSPRGPAENAPESVPFLGCGVGGAVNTNQTVFQVNVDSGPNLEGVYAVPNPLRRRGGWDLGEAATLRFVNVTPGSKCEIFTLAGDLVVELTNVITGGIQRGNIEWDTRNGAGEEVASGVYIYRITNDAGEEIFGRVTIIR